MKNTTYRNQCLKRQKILPILLVIVIYNFNSFRLLKIYRIEISLICKKMRSRHILFPCHTSGDVSVIIH